MFLVSHPSPLTNERALECWTYIDASYGEGWEKLYVADQGEGVWRLCNLPYHVFGLKVGALLRVGRDGRIVELLGNPEAHAFRLKLRDVEARGACLSRLSGFVVEPMFTTFVGVQEREGQAPGTLNAALARLMHEGLVLDTEDADASAFDPGPESTEPALSGVGPLVHEPREVEGRS